MEKNSGLSKYDTNIFQKSYLCKLLCLRGQLILAAGAAEAAAVVPEQVVQQLTQQRQPQETGRPAEPERQGQVVNSVPQGKKAARYERYLQAVISSV